MSNSSVISALVHTLRYEADGIISVELRPWGDTVFAPFEAGAHIDLHLPNGLVRSYSLLNAPSEQGRYVVGILRDRASRGGSRYVHEQLRVGMELKISQPRNNFALDTQPATACWWPAESASRRSSACSTSCWRRAARPS